MTSFALVYIIKKDIFLSMAFEPTCSKFNYIIPFPYPPTWMWKIKLRCAFSCPCFVITYLFQAFLLNLLCEHLHGHEKTQFSIFCINDGELVGNIWEKKEEEKVEKGFGQFGTLPLGKSITLWLVKQSRMSLIKFVRVWRSIIINLDALLHPLSNDNWQLKRSMSCGCESYDKKL